MASGFFLGGAAEGMQNAAELGIKRDALSQDLALKTRGLDIQQQTADQGDRRLGQDLDLRTRALNLQAQGQANAEQRALFGQADKQVSDTMAIVAETVSAGLAAGRDPAAVSKAVQPLVDQAKRIAKAVGRDPGAIDAQLLALAARPTGTETATAKGTGEAATAVAKAKGLEAGGIVDENAGFKDKKQLVESENQLRDDYMKNASPFVIARDFYRSYKQADDSGAGDITRVFAFMKMQEPTSAVMPGEAANVNNAGGVPEAARGMYNKLIGGGTLSPGARKQISSQIERLWVARQEQHKDTVNTFTKISERQKLNPKNVVIPLDSVGGSRVSSAFDDMSKLPPPPAGFQIVK